MLAFNPYASHIFMKGMVSAQFNLVAAAMSATASTLKLAGAFSFAPKIYEKLAAPYEASATFLQELGRKQERPGFNLTSTTINGQSIGVTEETVARKPYCDLIRFRRDTNRNDPKILLVTPMSGNFPALFRETVETLLPGHDVYVTNWKNACDVPASEGEFNLTDDYIGYVKDFIRTTGPGTHVMGVSQSTVPLFAGVALMAAENDPCRPVSCTLAGGPVDTRAGRMEINRFADAYPMSWFADNFIIHVPDGYAGKGQAVCPGYLQQNGFALAGALSPPSVARMFNRLSGKTEEPSDIFGTLQAMVKPTMDSSRAFFLETIWHVFKNHSLARGELKHRGQTVDPAFIRDTALFTIEAEKDIICGPDQTLAAHLMCRNLPQAAQYYYLQPKAGHYDVFQGNAWQNEIAPRLFSFIRKTGKDAGQTYTRPPAESGPLIALKRWNPATIGPALKALYPASSPAPKLVKNVPA